MFQETLEAMGIMGFSEEEQLCKSSRLASGGWRGPLDSCSWFCWNQVGPFSSQDRFLLCEFHSLKKGKKEKENECDFRWFIGALEKWLHELGLFQGQVTQIGLNKKENDSLIELNHFQGYWLRVSQV